MPFSKWIALVLLCFGFHNSVAAVTIITSIPSGGYTINAPGEYELGNDITWTPTGDGQAILIAANNVTLDLKQHTLQSTLTNFNTIGVLALASENVTIKNGTILNMAVGGIKCELCQNVFIKNIIVDGLNKSDIINYTVPTGILVSLSNNAHVNNCIVRNVDVTTGSLAGIQMTTVLFSVITDCQVLNLINRDGACTGIGHLLSNNITVQSCTIDNLKSEFVSNLNTAGHTAIGIIPVSSANILIEKCSVSNIAGCCDDAHGMSLFECNYGKIKKSKVKNVIDGLGAAQTGAKSTGIEVYASNVKVVKCKVKNIVAINPQDKQATGFSCAQCDFVKFKKCYAQDVSVIDENGNQNASLGYGTGFGWAPDPREQFIKPSNHVTYEHCTATSCQVGFDSWFHTNSVWKHIRSICNGISVLDINHSQRTISCDACSECTVPITVTIDNVATNNTFKHVKATYCQ